MQLFALTSAYIYVAHILHVSFSLVVQVVSIWREMYQGVRNSKASCQDQGHYVSVCV